MLAIKNGTKKLKIYETIDGIWPYSEWIQKLRDTMIVARIRVRADRIESGNLGQYKALGAGLFELKFDFGPGYRVYFTVDGDEIILLLLGGDKATQRKDIARAREFAADYITRKRK